MTTDLHEALAAQSLRAEMLAEGLVEKDGETVTFHHNGREFMVEVKCFDVTETADMSTGSDHA